MPEAHLKDLEVDTYSARGPFTQNELINLLKQVIQTIYTKMD